MSSGFQETPDYIRLNAVPEAEKGRLVDRLMKRSQTSRFSQTWSPNIVQ